MYNIEYFEGLLKDSNDVMTVSVAAPYDEGTIEAIEHFRQLGLLNATLVGDEEKITAVLKKCNVDEKTYKIISATELPEVARISVTEVANGNANFLMKGLIDTSILLGELLKKEHGLRTTKHLSHVGVFYKEGTDRLLFLSDAGMNIEPDLAAKKSIIENTVEVAHSLNIMCPNVAMLCAKEKVYEKMPATVDAAALQKMNQDGEITGCVVSGPLQLDNAVSLESAKTKGVTDPVAGKADILIVPDINVGNIFGKGLLYLAEGYQSGGIIMGAKVPIVLTSRSDGAKEKRLSLSLAIARAQMEVK